MRTEVIGGKMKVLSLALGCLFLTLSLQRANCVPLPEFFLFGPNFGDTELDQGDDVTATVDLQQTIPYLGEQRHQIIVCTAVFMMHAQNLSKTFVNKGILPEHCQVYLSSMHHSVDESFAQCPSIFLIIMNTFREDYRIAHSCSDHY